MNAIQDLLSDRVEDLTGVSADPVQITDDEPGKNIFEITHSTTNQPDFNHVKSMIYKMKDDLDAVLRALDGNASSVAHPKVVATESAPDGEQIIEGVFNGEKMIGPDGHEYAVPPNYASKSKLVEGDMMKLTITKNGTFIYKQTSPVDRKRIVGRLIKDGAEMWSVDVNGKIYKILTASVTFYKGNIGDDCVILVPQDGNSNWGAVENIIHK